jgi:hypothetical protein
VNEREANLMGALASVGDELAAVRTLGVWPLAPEARTVFLASLREKADSIHTYADGLEAAWTTEGGSGG